MNSHLKEPSPFTLGPPRNNFVPRPTRADSAGPTLHPPSPVGLRARYSFSTMGSPPIAHKLNVLSEYLESCPPQDHIQNKVIAVDGLDRNAVRMVISELHYNISKDLQCPVRVIGDEFAQRPINETSDMAHYVAQIHNWAAMWRMISEASPPDCSIGARSSQPERLRGHIQSSLSDRLCIWIMPLSPLMVTFRAATRIAMTGTFGPSDLWRWLASHWAGYLKPDITINLQEIADTATKPEVLRFEGSNMNTLLVTKLRDSDILSSSQMRRVTFEIEDWIQGEGEGGFSG